MLCLTCCAILAWILEANPYVFLPCSSAVGNVTSCPSQANQKLKAVCNVDEASASSRFAVLLKCESSYGKAQDLRRLLGSEVSFVSQMGFSSSAVRAASTSSAGPCKIPLHKCSSNNKGCQFPPLRTQKTVFKPAAHVPGKQMNIFQA
eukprot:1154034-Pelagomonas_calceolata.AAC.2